MTEYTVPKKNDAGGIIFYVNLLDMAGNGSYKSSPTLAAGDVKISKDGGALSNLGTLPAVTPAASIWVKVTLSQSEINCDNATIQFIDQTSPKEWCDLAVELRPATRKLEDLAFPTTTGRSMDVDASGGVEVGSFQAGAITSAALAADAIGKTAVANNARGTVGSSSSTTSVVTSALSPAGAAANQFSGRTILFDEDTTTTGLRGCARTITASSNASLPVLTVDALPTAPASGDTFQIV